MPDIRSCIRAGVSLAFALALMTSLPLSAQDDFEDDDTAETAVYIGVDAPGQAHEFDALADEDWTWFYASAGQHVEIRTSDLTNDCDTFLSLFSAVDTVTPLAVCGVGSTEECTDDDTSSEQFASTLIFDVVTDGYFLIKAQFSQAPEAILPSAWIGVGYFLVTTHGTGGGCTIPGDQVFGHVKDSNNQPVFSSDPSAGLIVFPRDQFGIQKSDRLPTQSDGSWNKSGITSQDGGSFNLVFRFGGLLSLPEHVVVYSRGPCEPKQIEVVLNLNNISTVKVDFTRDRDAPQDGTDPGVPVGRLDVHGPYRTLGQAVAAVAPGGVVALAPGVSAETFSGSTKITKAMQLQNSNGAGGSTRIGVAPSRVPALESPPVTKPKTGFVSSRAVSHE